MGFLDVKGRTSNVERRTSNVKRMGLESREAVWRLCPESGLVDHCEVTRMQ